MILRSFALTAASLALALLPAASVSAAPDSTAPAPAADSGGVEWAVRTASNDFGSERTSFEYDLMPGGTLGDAIVIANHGDAPLQLRVYGADGFTSETGEFDALPSGETSKHIGVWAAPDADEVTIQPGADIEVPFTVAVPAEATPGDYAGAILTSIVRSDSAQAVDVDQRLGIRMTLHVGGEIRPALSVENVHVDYHGTLFGAGDATIGYTLRNTGNAILTATQAATIGGPFGWFSTAAPAIEDSPDLLPGETWEVTRDVSGVWPLVWVTSAVTATPLYTDASGSTSALAVQTGSGCGWAVPWALLIALGVIAIAVLLWLRLRTRAAARRRAREDERVREAVEAALREKEPV